MDVITLKKQNQPKPLITYKILLSNGQVIECLAETYEGICDENGDILAYQFFKDKRIVLELSGIAVNCIMDNDSVDVSKVIAALKKKPRSRKKV